MPKLTNVELAKGLASLDRDNRNYVLRLAVDLGAGRRGRKRGRRKKSKKAAAETPEPSQSKKKKKGKAVPPAAGLIAKKKARQEALESEGGE